MTKYKDFYDFRINFKLDQLLRSTGRADYYTDEDIKKLYQDYLERESKDK